jgi:phosphatidate cytidylyltransferase
MWSAFSYYLIFLFILTMSLMEFYTLLGLDGNLPLKTYGTFVGIISYSISFLVEMGYVANKAYFAIPLMLSIVFLIKLYKKSDISPFRNIAYTFLGIIYVALPFCMLNIAVLHESRYNREVILGTMLILWASDSGAYFSGKTMGKRKLWERISPKKTWEGSVGGFLLALIVASIFSLYFHTLPWVSWAIIAVLIVIGGTYGDLVESLFKRSIRIKDSGKVLPGHGGFLDRFDGLLIATPFIVAYVEAFTIW